MHNRRCLSHGPVHRRHVIHVKVGRHNDGRSLGLKLTWRHGILRLRRLVRVPLLHLLHVLGVTVRRSILLLLVGVVGSIRIVMDRRVALRRQRIVLLLLSLSPPRYI
jgi:hypothetical protein